MSLLNHRGGSRYVFAGAATALAFIARLLMHAWLEASSPFLFFAPAVMLAAWYGGLGPGVLSTFVGAILANYFLLEPQRSLSFSGDNLARTVLFVLVGLQISWLSGAMHSARRRAEADAQTARRSEKLYRTLAANFPDGFVCLFDAELRWTLVAGAGLENAGLMREQMEGRRIGDTLPTETAKLVEAMCSNAIRGEATKREITYRSRTYLCHALPLKSQDDLTHVGMIIVEDVTDRAKAREALQWAHDNLEQRVRERTAELHFQKTLLESQSEASVDGILAIGNDGRVIFINHRLSTMWNLNGAVSEAQPDDLRREMRAQLQPHQPDPISNERNEQTLKQGSEELTLNDGRTIERYSSSIIDPAGISFGRVWFYRDITEQKRMQRQILEIAERERQRIGQDLHDDLCQQLAGIACLGQALHQQLSGRATARTQDAASAAMEIVEQVQRANQRARDLARGLQPLNLQRYGLPAALQDLCHSIHEVFHVACAFRSHEVPQELDKVVSSQLYRISQEAISNAIRHGKAEHLLIDLIFVGDRLILSIEDDGKGISQPIPEGGMGLQTMSYRARLVGGSLTIDRQQPRGTTVTCTVPIPVRTGQAHNGGHDDG